LTVETFLRGANMAFVSTSPGIFCRESATLYSIRVQVDRFCLSNTFLLPQFGLVCRRLTHLLKTFTLRLSAPYIIAHCAFFASSLCDMLYRLEEFVALHGQCSSASGNYLRKAVDELYVNVVKRLNYVLLHTPDVNAWNGLPSSSPTTSGYVSRSRSAQRLNASTPVGTLVLEHTWKASPSRYGKPSSRKGFILPADVEEQRRRSGVRRNASRSMTSISLNTGNQRTRSALRSGSALIRDESSTILRANTNMQLFREAGEMVKGVVEDLAEKMKSMELRKGVHHWT